MSERAMRRFDGKLAVVTGAASGIGAATARRLAREGAETLLADLDINGLAKVEAQIADAGGQARSCPLDVSDDDAWRRLAHDVAQRHGGIDVLVSNAATVCVAPAHELEPPDWDRQLAVNLKALYLAFRSFQGLWRPAASAVAVSSVHAHAGLTGHPAYAASKAGLLGLVQQLAVDYGPDVRVNAVVPGPIMSPVWDRVDDDGRRRSVEQTILRRFGTPEEVAALIAFLTSSEASYLTGTSVVIDGGWLVAKDSA